MSLPDKLWDLGPSSYMPYAFRKSDVRTSKMPCLCLSFSVIRKAPSARRVTGLWRDVVFPLPREVQRWCTCRLQSSEGSRAPPLPRAGSLCCQALQSKGQQWDEEYLCSHLHFAIKSVCLALQKLLLLYFKREILKRLRRTNQKAQTITRVGALMQSAHLWWSLVQVRTLDTS